MTCCVTQWAAGRWRPLSLGFFRVGCGGGGRRPQETVLLGAPPSSAALDRAASGKWPRKPEGAVPARAWSWLRTPLVPVLWVKGAEQVPRGQRGPPLWGGGCWASRNLWSGLALAVASDCRLSAGEGRWRLSLTEEEAGAQRGRGAGPGPHGEATATPGALEKGVSGEVEVPGEVGVSVVGVGRVLWVPLGQEPVSPHRRVPGRVDAFRSRRRRPAGRRARAQLTPRPRYVLMQLCLEGQPAHLPGVLTL